MCLVQAIPSLGEFAHAAAAEIFNPYAALQVWAGTPAWRRAGRLRDSPSGARTSGMTADQILGWLDGHLTAEVPALLEVAVRNWTGRQSIKLSQVQLLRIVQPQAKEALLHSATFRPFLGGHIPPDWFVVRDEHLSEVRGLLERLGFTIGDSLDPPPLEGLESPAKDSPAAVDRTNSIAK